MEDVLEIYSRSYLSISHLSAMCLFAEECGELESGIASGQPVTAHIRRRHKACVIAAILQSAAFLEAEINELFADCAEYQDRLQVAALPAPQLMARLWRRGIPRTARYSILEKYEIALELNNLPGFDTSRAPYQDVARLVELRNALIHYEPETVFIPDSSCGVGDYSHKFEKKLKGKFKFNPLTGEGNPFYPDKLLGHGCADWAVKSAVALSDEFFSRLAVSPPYEHVRGDYGL